MKQNTAGAIQYSSNCSFYDSISLRSIGSNTRMQKTKLRHSLTYFLRIVGIDALCGSQANKLLQGLTSVVRVLGKAGKAVNPLRDPVESNDRRGLAGTASREPVKDHMVDCQIVPKFCLMW